MLWKRGALELLYQPGACIWNSWVMVDGALTLPVAWMVLYDDVASSNIIVITSAILVDISWPDRNTFML